MEWKKLRRKIQVPAYIQFFISIVFWIAAGLGLYGTLPPSGAYRLFRRFFH